MPQKITIVYTGNGSADDIKIAGNFTNWASESLTYNESNGLFEYQVKPSSELGGKLYFKFIQNGKWLISTNYSSEFDDAGNENNVVIYDKEEQKAIDRAAELCDLDHKNPLVAPPQTPATPTDIKETLSNSAISEKSNGKPKDFATFTGLGDTIPTAASTSAIEESYKDPLATIVTKPSAKEKSLYKPEAPAVTPLPLFDETTAGLKPDLTTAQKDIPATQVKTQDEANEYIPLAGSTSQIKAKPSSTTEVPSPQPETRPEPPTQTALSEPAKEKALPPPTELPSARSTASEIFTLEGEPSKSITASESQTAESPTFITPATSAPNTAADTPSQQQQHENIVAVRNKENEGNGSVDSLPGFFVGLIAAILQFFRSFFG